MAHVPAACIAPAAFVGCGRTAEVRTGADLREITRLHQSLQGAALPAAISAPPPLNLALVHATAERAAGRSQSLPPRPHPPKVSFGLARPTPPPVAPVDNSQHAQLHQPHSSMAAVSPQAAAALARAPGVGDGWHLSGTGSPHGPGSAKTALVTASAGHNGRHVGVWGGVECGDVAKTAGLPAWGAAAASASAPERPSAAYACTGHAPGVRAAAAAPHGQGSVGSGVYEAAYERVQGMLHAARSASVPATQRITPAAAVAALSAPPLAIPTVPPGGLQPWAAQPAPGGSRTPRGLCGGAGPWAACAGGADSLIAEQRTRSVGVTGTAAVAAMHGTHAGSTDVRGCGVWGLSSFGGAHMHACSKPPSETGRMSAHTQNCSQVHGPAGECGTADVVERQPSGSAIFDGGGREGSGLPAATVPEAHSPASAQQLHCSSKATGLGVPVGNDGAAGGGMPAAAGVAGGVGAAVRPHSIEDGHGAGAGGSARCASGVLGGAASTEGSAAGSIGPSGTSRNVCDLRAALNATGLPNELGAASMCAHGVGPFWGETRGLLTSGETPGGGCAASSRYDTVDAEARPGSSARYGGGSGTSRWGADGGGGRGSQDSGSASVRDLSFAHLHAGAQTQRQRGTEFPNTGEYSLAAMSPAGCRGGVAKAHPQPDAFGWGSQGDSPKLISSASPDGWESGDGSHARTCVGMSDGDTVRVSGGVGGSAESAWKAEVFSGLAMAEAALGGAAPSAAGVLGRGGRPPRWNAPERGAGRDAGGDVRQKLRCVESLADSVVRGSGGWSGGEGGLPGGGDSPRVGVTAALQRLACEPVSFSSSVDLRSSGAVM